MHSEKRLPVTVTGDRSSTSECTQAHSLPDQEPETPRRESVLSAEVQMRLVTKLLSWCPQKQRGPKEEVGEGHHCPLVAKSAIFRKGMFMREIGL